MIPAHDPAASWTMAGCLAAILSSVRAAPLGWMVPRSHLRTAPWGNPGMRAKAFRVTLVSLRICAASVLAFHARAWDDRYFSGASA